MDQYSFQQLQPNISPVQDNYGEFSDDKLLTANGCNLGSVNDDSLMSVDDDYLMSANDDNLIIDEEVSVNTKAVKTISKFPSLTQCLPKWKEVFPWVKFDENSNIISCSLCLQITAKYFPEQAYLAEVIKITCPADIFNIAKLLRSHGESQAHCLTWCLLTPNSLHSLISISGSHYLECKTETDALEIIRAIFHDKQFKYDMFTSAVKYIANFIEANIIEMLKSCTFYSVVADQCRGIIILRIVEHNKRVAEHVLWSYVSIYDKTPMEYLQRFGLDSSRLILYIANTPCQQCQRCSNSVTERAKLPPRSPSIRFFSCLLWQESAFRPLFYVLNQIVKLWKLYPFVFLKKLPQFDFSYLLTFYFNPNAVIPLFDHYESFREVFLEIYERQHLLECLGLYHTKLICEEKQRKFLAILQEILEIIGKTGRLRSISTQEIIKLSQALVSLKLNSKGLAFIKKNPDIPPDPIADRLSADSVVDLVEKFIDENKKIIYYCGKEKLPSLFHLFRTKSLLNTPEPSLNTDSLFLAFKTFHDAFGGNFRESFQYLLKCLIEYYTDTIASGIYIETCIDMVDLFWKCPEYQEKYRCVYKISLLSSTLPFQPCRLRRQMFTAFVAEQKYEGSFWVKKNSSLKSSLLYIHDELPFVNATVAFKWWKNLASKT